MNTDADIWLAFARTFGMLFVVLGFFLLAFYLFKRFSGVAGGKGAKSLIQVLAVHHVSPKEKLVLVKVMNEIILIGVTPQNISKLAVLEGDDADFQPQKLPGQGGFSDLLAKTLGKKASDNDPGVDHVRSESRE
jgi:flagellar protein FliO/FliZ